MNIKDKPKDTGDNFYNQTTPTPSELEERHSHLQTILLITQLNSSFFEMRLTTQRAFQSLSQKYRSLKLEGFLLIKHCKVNRSYLATVRLLRLPAESELELDDNQCSSREVAAHRSEVLREGLTEIKLQKTLSRIGQMMVDKRASQASYAFLRVYRCTREQSILHLYSEKSSKNETSDTMKNKIFRRSNEREQRASRKSYSVEKSAQVQKHQYYVPNKYQGSQVLSSPRPSSTKQIPDEDNSVSGLGLSRLMQGVLGPERRNLVLASNRQRKGLKSSSSNKYIAAEGSSKEEKLRELDYLKRKYRKLIAEFNWFSERFLKVIDEEEV